MKFYILIVLFFLSFLRPTFSQVGWVQQSSGTTLNLYDIYFINDMTGYFCAGHILNSTGIVKKSTDGGISWFTVLNLSAQLKGISFSDVNTGTVVGSSNTIYKTTNGGINWIQQTVPSGAGSSYNSVFFLNSSIGMIVGALNVNGDGAILYTSDGGANWFNRGYGHDAVYFDLQIFDNTTAIVVGAAGPSGTIIKTTNSGVNWFIQNTGGVYRSISFIDNNNGLVTGSGSNNLGRTTNGGTNWFFQTNAQTYSFEDVKKIDMLSAFSVGENGAIWKTIDGGVNWFQQSSGTTKDLNAGSFINSTTGWVCGDTSILIKTTNGGITAIQPTSNELPVEYELLQNYPNPFNPITNIRFELPVSSEVKIEVFDVLGRLIATILNDKLNAGQYEMKWQAENYPSGVYFYKLSTDIFTETKKMILLK